MACITCLSHSVVCSPASLVFSSLIPWRGLLQAEADQALNDITASMAKASEQKRQAEQLEVSLAADQRLLAQRKAVIEGELAECQPRIDAAKQAVGHISQAAMEEVRTHPLAPFSHAGRDGGFHADSCTRAHRNV